MTRDAAWRYANSVVKGRTLAGELVRAACKRHLDDLDTGHERGLRYDARLASRACRFFPAFLTLTVGEHDGKPFQLLPWQTWVISSLFGWVREDTGHRRYRTAYIETAKGSGKTPLAAGIGVRAICADGEPGAQCYVIARTAEQASVTFRFATAYVQSNARLATRLQIMGGSNPYNIVDLGTGSFMRRVATEREGRGASGPNPSCVIVDELHEHSTPDMRDAYALGVKGRRQPLVLQITNSGASLQSPCGVEHVYAAKLARGDLTNDSYFSAIYSIDKDDDPMNDERCWPKANPSLPLLPGHDYIRKAVEEARGMPSKRSKVERFNFCRWVDSEDPWIAVDAWDGCEVPEVPEDVRADWECVAALDLSVKTDLTAGVLCWYRESPEDGQPDYWVEATAWTPRDTMRQRAERDAAPYEQWADEGHLQTMPGSVIDPGPVVDWLMQAYDELNLVALTYDSFRVDMIETEFQRRSFVTTREDGGPGLRILPHKQGFQAGPAYKASDAERDLAPRDTHLYMSRSIEATEAAISAGRLHVARNPCLRSASLGMVVIADGKGNRSISKLKSTVRIDPAVALLMAVGSARARIDVSPAITSLDDLFVDLS